MKHRMTKHWLYTRWANIKQRCNNPKRKDYKYYGGRGINMCAEWADNFMLFNDYVSSLDNYCKDLTIDRIDGDKNYEPGNIRWISRLDQRLNQNKETRKPVLNRRSGYFSGKKVDNTSGYYGVCKILGKEKWVANSRLNKKTIYLGIYNNPEDANKAVLTFLKNIQILEYKILKRHSSNELAQIVNEHIEEGWTTKGSHKVVRRHEQLRYAGMQHKDTTYEYEYTQAMIKFKNN